MRLIDLDEIEYFTLVDKDGIPRYKIEIGDGLPIVNAIPVEWIKNIINANRYLWEKHKEKMFIDQGVVTIVNYSLTAQILSELIDRWEKEHEKDI